MTTRMIRSVEELILHARREAARTRKRQRVEAIRIGRPEVWAYQVVVAHPWPDSPERQAS